MESDEQIYMNIEELQGNADERYTPREAGKPVRASVSPTPAVTEPVRTEASARVKPQTWPRFKASTVCLVLLCLLLLTAVLAVGVLYDRDFYQLSRDLANQTAEKHQLLIQNQNLTDERDQLQTGLKRTKLQLKNLTETVGSCPHGWRRLGCSCYLFVKKVNTWSNSRQICRNQGADLVITNSQREMMFLNQFGAALTFWIGLNEASRRGNWMWTDGSSLQTGYWIEYHMPDFSKKLRCAAFNSFTVSWGNIRSWTPVSCNEHLQSVCEKEADMSGLAA